MNAKHQNEFRILKGVQFSRSSVKAGSRTWTRWFAPEMECLHPTHHDGYWREVEARVAMSCGAAFPSSSDDPPESLAVHLLRVRDVYYAPNFSSDDRRRRLTQQETEALLSAWNDLLVLGVTMDVANLADYTLYDSKWRLADPIGYHAHYLRMFWKYAMAAPGILGCMPFVTSKMDVEKVPDMRMLAGHTFLYDPSENIQPEYP
jgi:hypothetical protein